jgi:exopolyphosphatase/guanosine-5'-triphosphate,3'-diphosphate pyrophosphatase
MGGLKPEPRFSAGRYAAIDVGSNSVLGLVADVDEEGRLNPVADGAIVTRLGERFYAQKRLVRPARERTLAAITEFARVARQFGADCIGAVGTSVVREAGNAAEFLAEVWHECNLPLEVISGEQEAELAYSGNLHDRGLPGTDGERIVLDIGGGSTEVVRGFGPAIRGRASYALGAARLTELFLKGDPPSAGECAAAQTAIEEALSGIDPRPNGSLVLASGGTVCNLASIALSSGMSAGPNIHGLTLKHAQVNELVELLQSLPLKFRKRVPGLEPERADVIFGGALILHQLMARLSSASVVVSVNGVRHGCVYALSQRALQRR